MGHSMGSRMASSFVATHQDQPLDGVILAGCRNDKVKILSCKNNVQEITIPVLDIWGVYDKKDVKSARGRKVFVSKNYTQIEIPKANYFKQ